VLLRRVEESGKQDFDLSDMRNVVNNLRLASMYLYLYLFIKHLNILILQRFKFFIELLDLISTIKLIFSSNNITICIFICIEIIISF
jgi:hypothetical protein